MNIEVENSLNETREIFGLPENIEHKYYLKIKNLITTKPGCRWFVENPIVFKKNKIKYKIEAVSTFQLETSKRNGFSQNLFFTVRQFDKKYDFNYSTIREHIKKKQVYIHIADGFRNRIELNNTPHETIIYEAEYKHFSKFPINIIKKVYLQIFKNFYKDKFNISDYSQDEIDILFIHYSDLFNKQVN